MQRLIDANKLENEINQFDYYDQVKDAPTVLTIPDNPTNGDMIKAVFPNTEITEFWSAYRMDDIPNKVIINKDWWNSPYKRGDTDGSN